MKRLLTLLLCLCLLVLAVNITANYRWYSQGGDWRFSISFSLALVTVGWGGYILLYYGLFRDRLNWKRRPYTSFVLSIVISGLYGVALIVSAMKLLVFTGVLTQEKSADAYAINSMYAALFAMMCGLIINGQNFLSRWKKSVAEHERIQRELLQAKYMALQYQVNPHFFFNALNTLNGLISEDTGMAMQFVNCLSRVFRYSLQHGNEQTVALKEELKVAEDLLFIIRQRFLDKIQVHIDLPQQVMDMHIAGYALLTLVENAIKHNEISREYPLLVKIFHEPGYIVVGNSYRPKDTGRSASGMGLSNIQERYKVMTPQPVVIERGALFTVKIPLLLS